MWTRPSQRDLWKGNWVSVSAARESSPATAQLMAGVAYFSLLFSSTALVTDCRPWDGTGCDGMGIGWDGMAGDWQGMA